MQVKCRPVRGTRRYQCESTAAWGVPREVVKIESTVALGVPREAVESESTVALGALKETS